MIKVLELSASLDGGGVDRLLYDFTTRMMDEIHFDFVVTSETEGILERDLRDRGSSIFHIHQMSGDFFGYLKNLDDIIKQGKYDIVHDHMNQASMGSMIVARLNKVPVRIAHAHTCMYGEKLSRKIKRKIMAYISAACATNLCACGEKAAQWMWGKRSIKCYIVRNAINLKEFYFSREKRNVLRKEYNLTDRFVVGNVARLSDEKNQLFLLDVFKIITEISSNAYLVFVGNGYMEQELKNKVHLLGLNSKVLFLGIRNDVPELLNMLDVFVLPSKYEGFPVTLVEAQANGLPVVVSDNVTQECVLTQNFSYLSIEESPKIWAEKIIEHHERIQISDKRLLAYDIETEAMRLKEFYKSALNAAAKIRKD